MAIILRQESILSALSKDSGGPACADLLRVHAGKHAGRALSS